MHCGAKGSGSIVSLMIWYWQGCAVGSGHWSESGASSSESMLGGSGSSSKDGVLLGMCFSLVNINAPSL